MSSRTKTWFYGALFAAAFIGGEFLQAWLL